MPTVDDCHKAMIHLCLAVEKLADALEAEHHDYTEANCRNARELINDAHRQMEAGDEADGFPPHLHDIGA